nr:Proteinase inhibitor I2 and EGF calcium-binding domain containing protein [Haemonchus contortus]
MAVILALGLILFSSFRLTHTGEPAFIKNPEDRCKETVDPGPCQYYQTKWFWNEVDESCKEFHYGGCMGNKNRFNTKHECLKQCRYKLFNPVAVPDLCLLEPDPGVCEDERAGQWWYYFDSDKGTCEKFFYYGCGGNDNKFYSLHMCNKINLDGISFEACEHCDLRTSFCKSHGKFNYTCECRVGYEKNTYGECIDIDECRGYTAVCDRNAWCTNTIGSYSCECMASYRGDGKHCTYVGLGRSSLDCQDCSPDATCESGVCQCKEGFEGDDVNECLRTPHVCDRNAECINREGSFICTCVTGFAGNGYNCTKTKNACLDKFDRGYQETCGGENWRQHYFLDHQSKT